MLDILLIVVIGGMGTMYGAVIGGALFVLAQNYLQDLMGAGRRRRRRRAAAGRSCSRPTAGCCGSACCSCCRCTTSRPASSARLRARAIHNPEETVHHDPIELEISIAAAALASCGRCRGPTASGRWPAAIAVQPAASRLSRRRASRTTELRRHHRRPADRRPGQDRSGRRRAGFAAAGHPDRRRTAPAGDLHQLPRARSTSPPTAATARLYGPNVDVDGNATLGEGKIAGTEYIAYADDGSGKQNVTHDGAGAGVVRPRAAPASSPATSSGSRGVYGAIGSAGRVGPEARLRGRLHRQGHRQRRCTTCRPNTVPTCIERHARAQPRAGKRRATSRAELSDAERHRHSTPPRRTASPSSTRTRSTTPRRTGAATRCSAIEFRVLRAERAAMAPRNRHGATPVQITPAQHHGHRLVASPTAAARRSPRPSRTATA